MILPRKMVSSADADPILFPPFADTSTYFFITLIRQGAHVILTQMMNTHDTMVRGALEFPNLIKLNNITQDFKLDLEIYSMVGSRRFYQWLFREIEKMHVDLNSNWSVWDKEM